MEGLDAWFASKSIWEISYPELALRMATAIVLGGLIGMEREWNNHPAGFRTHILVCLGSATIMMLSIYGFSAFVDELNVRIDPARLAAQVVSGIGFLGAGAILRNGSMVTGLTTAASVWIVASIGLCVGAGFYKGAFSAAILVLISLHLFNRWEKRWMRHRRYHSIDLIVAEIQQTLSDLMRIFGEHGITVKKIKVEPDPQEGKVQAIPLMHVQIQLRAADPGNLNRVLMQAALLGQVRSVEGSAFEYRKNARPGDGRVLDEKTML